MTTSLKRRIRKILKVLTILILMVLIGVALIPYPVPKAVREEIKEVIRKSTSAQLMPCMVDPKGDKALEIEFAVEQSVDVEDLDDIAAIFEYNVFDKRIARIRCFDPHHAIRFHQKNGDTYDIVVCFHCRNMTAGKSDLYRFIDLPRAWESGLRELFQQHGLTEHLYETPQDSPRQKRETGDDSKSDH